MQHIVTIKGTKGMKKISVFFWILIALLFGTGAVLFYLTNIFETMTLWITIIFGLLSFVCFLIAFFEYRLLAIHVELFDEGIEIKQRKSQILIKKDQISQIEPKKEILIISLADGQNVKLSKYIFNKKEILQLMDWFQTNQ